MAAEAGLPVECPAVSAPTWTPGNVVEEKPEEGEEVEVITPGGDQRNLVWSRGMWWLPDMSMYVYFRPAFWRSIK